MLAQALTALAHPPPADLHGVGPAELLAWASAHWQIENVPRESVVANSFA
jgi:glutamyl-Q tRNA(Asp) synthetase